MSRQRGSSAVRIRKGKRYDPPWPQVVVSSPTWVPENRYRKLRQAPPSTRRRKVRDVPASPTATWIPENRYRRRQVVLDRRRDRVWDVPPTPILPVVPDVPLQRTRPRVRVGLERRRVRVTAIVPPQVVQAAPSWIPPRLGHRYVQPSVLRRHRARIAKAPLTVTVLVPQPTRHRGRARLVQVRRARRWDTPGVSVVGEDISLIRIDCVVTVDTANVQVSTDTLNVQVTVDTVNVQTVVDTVNVFVDTEGT